MDVEFRKGTMEDLGACAEAINDSTCGDAYFQTKESRENAVLEGIEKGTLYVMLCDGKCAGFCYYISEGAFHAFPYIHLFFLHKDYRGLGLGKRFIAYIHDIVFQTRNKVFLVVGDYNPGAKVFYEKMGYEEVGRIPSLYREGIREDVMMKRKDTYGRS